MGRTIRGSSPITTVVTYNGYSFRSNFMIPIVRHCFETTFISGCKGYHTGFSPSNTERTFITHWGQSIANKPSFAGRSPDVNSAYTNGLTLNEGSTVMTCLDSKISLITAKINNEEKKLTFNKVKDTKTWYAYIDAGGNCASLNNNATVKVNLGKKKFNNTMPEGYAPFIYGYYDIINDIRCTNMYHRMSPLIYCIMTLVLVS